MIGFYAILYVLIRFAEALCDCDVRKTQKECHNFD
jgi:hypothetical protein